MVVPGRGGRRVVGSAEGGYVFRRRSLVVVWRWRLPWWLLLLLWQRRRWLLLCELLWHVIREGPLVSGWLVMMVLTWEMEPRLLLVGQSRHNEIGHGHDRMTSVCLIIGDKVVKMSFPIG